jgi:hypothetical protein
MVALGRYRHGRRAEAGAQSVLFGNCLKRLIGGRERMSDAERLRHDLAMRCRHLIQRLRETFGRQRALGDHGAPTPRATPGSDRAARRCYIGCQARPIVCQIMQELYRVG